MKELYEVNIRARLGPDTTDDKHVTLLNRCLSWTNSGLRWECDPRRAEIVIRDLSSEISKGPKVSIPKGPRVKFPRECPKVVRVRPRAHEATLRP